VSNKTHKAGVKALLIQKDFDGVLNWMENVRNPQRVLLSLVYDTDELVKWQAIDAVGKMAAFQAKSDLEKVRNLIRQQLWLMNDESGGLGWHSPEIVGEILVNVPQLIDEFAQLFLAYLDEEPFERGSHLAIYRVASVNPQPFIERVSELSNSIDSPDPQIRACTLMALSKIDDKMFQTAAQKLNDDESAVTLYDFDTGLLVNTSVNKVINGLLNSANSSTRAA
jgi:hypothetical protein